MEWLFLLGIFLIPFENFKFAPSAGWAAVAPIVFTMYSICNIKYLKKILLTYWKYFALFILGFIILITNIIFMSDTERVFALKRTFDALETMVLGIGSLMALHVYFIEKGNNLEKIEKIILIAYSITLFVGILQFITIKFNIQAIYDLFDKIAKRNYYFTSGRVQFCFTECSFIGLHLYGVLLPIYLFGKNKKVRNLIILYAFLAIVFGCGVRVILDTLVVCLILMLRGLFTRKNWAMVIAVISIAVLPVSISFLYVHNDRVKNIVQQGIYVDNSLASRFFYVQSTCIGFSKNIENSLCGYGIGQEPYVMQKGYKEAINTFKAGYKGEVESVEEADQWTTSSGTFCMYTRIAAEYGILLFIVCLIYIIYHIAVCNNSNMKLSIVVAMWLYVQFESYAFYTIWLLIVFWKMFCFQSKKQGEKV